MKRKIKVTALVISIALLVSSVAGCGSPTPAVSANPTEAVSPGASNSPEVAQRTSTKDTLIFANINDVGTFDPYADTAMQRLRVESQILEPLFILNNDGSTTPCLAESWEWTDNTHLTLHLRHGVKFHNGNDFTADDVLYTMQYAQNAPTVGKNYAKIDIANSVATDDYTVVLAFSATDGMIMSWLGTTALIMDKETCEADPERIVDTPVGTGPYKFVSWITGDSVTLAANDEYWGEKAIIKNVIFRSVSELTQRGIELQTGGVDFAFDMGATDVVSLESDTNFTVYKQASTLVNNVFYNTTEGHVFANEDLRKAVAYAISAEDIIKGAYDNNGTPPTSFVSSAAPGYDSSLEGKEFYPQDLTKAQEYFTKSGLAAGTTIQLIVDDRAQRIATAEILKNELEKIGLTVNIQSNDFGTTINKALNPANDWDLFLLGNGGATAAIQSTWLDGNTPFVTYPNTADGANLKALVQKMEAATDTELQYANCKQIQQSVIEHVPFVPIQQDQVLYGYNAKLQGVPDSIWGFAVVLCKDLYFN